MQKRKFINNTISSIALRVVTIICGFIIPRLILEFYGSSINGLVNSITQFLGLIIFLELGVGAVVQSALYGPLNRLNWGEISAIISSAQKFFNKIGWILVGYIFILLFLFPYLINDAYDYIFTSTLILAISISSFAQYFFGITKMLLLDADQRGYISYNIQILVLLLNTVACYFLIKMGMSIQIVKLTTSIIFLLRPIYLSYYVKKNYMIYKNIEYTDEPIKQKWNGIAQHIATILIDSTGYVILTIFTNLKLVSVFSVYSMVIVGVRSIVLSFTNGVQPLLGKLWAEQSMKELEEVFSWTEWSIHTLTSAIFGIAGVLIIPFIKVYTNGINDTNYIFPILALLITWGYAGHCYRLPYNLMILAVGHFRQTQKIYMVAAVSNVVISIISVKIWGINGASLGLISAMFLQVVLMAYYVSTRIIKLKYFKFFKQISIDLLSIMGIYLLSGLFIMEGISYFEWIILALKVSITTVVFLVIINYIFYKEKVKVILSKLL